MALNGATIILGISSANGNGSATGSGTTRRGGITKGGGIGASINKQGPLPILDPIVELFIELRWNYQGVKIEKLRNLQHFQCNPHENLQEAYAEMRKLIMVTQGVIEAQAV
jgi:hypothetical protein